MEKKNENLRDVTVSKISAPKATEQNVSGTGMDRKITTKQSLLSKHKYAVISVGVLAVVAFFIMKQPTGKSLAVTSQHMMISPVTTGIYEDFIPVRGRVTPAKTLYLDAVEGGRIEKILVEDGAMLKAGDLIVELSNASLQLSVLSNEARVAEQLNNMRSIELRLEQNRLEHKRNLLNTNYQIKLLSRQLEREEGLVGSGAIQRSQVDDTRDTLQWYKNSLVLTLESQASDTKMQESQLAFLKETGTRLEDNLAISRQNLENMNVRAPVAGKLSGFNVEIGQSIGRGERLGQIDTPNDFKVTAFIDEFYLGRIDIGQKANYKEYQLQISKIYPQVQNGQFEVDFKFINGQPNDIRRGQTVQSKLTLGDKTEATLIPNGSFYQDTGGKWIFVVTDDGQSAVRRNVRLGRRNSQFIEVIEGLEQGERVITSPYSSFKDMQRLNLHD